MRSADRGSSHRLAVAIGAGTGVETLVALTLVYAGIYSTGLTLGIVIAGTTLAVMDGLLRTLHARRAGSSSGALPRG